MTGYDQWSSLKQTLFSAQGNEYPELEQLPFVELAQKASVAHQWLLEHRDHPKYDEARRKYNWIIHYMGKKQPKELTPEQTFGYLL